MASIIALRPNADGSLPKDASVPARIGRSTFASGDGVFERAPGAAAAPDQDSMGAYIAAASPPLIEAQTNVRGRQLLTMRRPVFLVAALNAAVANATISFCDDRLSARRRGGLRRRCGCGRYALASHRHVRAVGLHGRVDRPLWHAVHCVFWRPSIDGKPCDRPQRFGPPSVPRVVIASRDWLELPVLRRHNAPDRSLGARRARPDPGRKRVPVFGTTAVETLAAGAVQTGQGWAIVNIAALPARRRMSGAEGA